MPIRSKGKQRLSISRAVTVACEALERRQLFSAVYVDAIAPGPTHNGSSWADAFSDLQSALGAVSAGQTIEVAHGTYTPTSGTDRTATFQLIDGVSLLGGFAGYGAANPDARNAANYPTILSGDIGAAGNSSDNSYHIVTAGGVDATAVLDGFTISGGNADASGDSSSGDGAGIFDAGGSPTINDCTFTTNSALQFGGGIYLSSGSPLITNCTFTGNSAPGGAGAGGGMYDAFASPVLTNCLFSNNTAGGSSASGGGGIFSARSSPLMTNCTFLRNSAIDGGGVRCIFSPVTLIDCSILGNTAANYGGGLLLDKNSAASTVTNCVFCGNSALLPGFGGGGAVTIVSAASANFTNCTFSGNSAASSGGALDLPTGNNTTLVNCIFWGDSAPTAPEVTASSITVTHCDIRALPGIGDIDANPLFVRNPSPGPDGIWGTADDDYGNLELQPDSPAVDAGSNASVPSGVTLDLSGNPRFQNVPTSAHTGSGTVPIVDMGAYEASATLSANAGGPYYVSQGQPLTLHGVGASNIAGALSYSWDLNGDGVFGDATGPNVPFSTANDAVGTQLTVTLRVTDAALNTVTSTATITVLPTLYVDQNATGNANGQSWANAYPALYTAINAAVSGQTIDVAQGTYFPTNGTLQTISFQLKNGVAIYGGFAGDTTATPGQRNIAAYPTILSGDIGKVGNNSDNSYTVVIASNVNATAILDGFTISFGNCNGLASSHLTFQNGGGIVVQESSPTISNCTISENVVAAGVGGGIYIYYSAPVLTNCTLSGNSSASTIFGAGGGIDATYSSPVLINCNFNNNFAAGNSDEGGGGGLYLYDSTESLINCTFNGNTASTGAAIELFASTLTMTDCALISNIASFQGGGIYNEGSVSLTNCTFSNNSATPGGDGGAIMESTGAMVTLANCILWGDSATNGNEIYNESVNTPAATYSDIQGGYPGLGNIYVDPQFVNAAAGSFSLQATSPCLNAGSNTAIQASGVATDLSGNPRIVGLIVDMGAYEVQPIAVAWTGGGDGINWNNPANWSNDAVPTLMNAATIPAGATPQLGSGIFAVASVSLQGAAAIDLGGATLEIDFGDAADPIAVIQSYIQSGYHNDTWTGSGIISSIAQGNPGRYAVGYADGNTDVGTPAQPGQVYISNTIAGDANLDGVVNFSDLLVVAQNFGKSGQNWAAGNFNYDTIVNFSDLLLIAQNYGQQLVAGQLTEDPTSFTPVATPDTSVPPPIAMTTIAPTATPSVADAPLTTGLPPIAPITASEPALVAVVATSQPTIDPAAAIVVPLTPIVSKTVRPVPPPAKLRPAVLPTDAFAAPAVITMVPPKSKINIPAQRVSPASETQITDDSLVGVWAQIATPSPIPLFS